MQPLQYLSTTGGMIWTAVCVLAGVLFTWLSYRIINVIPASWLCDYGETPGAELLSGQRVKYVPSGIVMSIITAVCLVLCRLQFNKGYDIYFILFSLVIVVSLMIAICDVKYTIIPDQFTIALALLGLIVSVYDLVRGFGILHTAWWSPIAGAAIGAGTMILIDLIGMLIYKRTGMGFGDVKLFAAVGLITGFPGTILSVIISMITGMICFVIILLAAKILAARHPAQETVADPESSVLQTAAETNDAGLQSEDAQTEETQETEDEKGGFYLAFGPYIAISLICYLCLYDWIYHLTELYLNLF